jgi:diguanylate cyclase (GGDEF)-like protein
MPDSVAATLEARIEHRTAALNAEIRRLTAMLDNLLDPQVLLQPERDEAGRVVDFILVYANRAACEWLGVDVEHVHNARLREILTAIHTTDLVSLLIDTADTGRTMVTNAFRVPRDSGSRWIDVRAVRVDGQISLAWRDVTEQRNVTRLLERRVRTDDLTSLLNRKEAIERIDALTSRTGQRIAVLSCDIDWFKTVNDTHGHAAGDSVLQAVAERIRGSLRSGDDLAARIGGDELLVVLHGVRDLDDAVAVAEKLRRRAAEPIHTAVGPITVTLSIGVTLARPSENTDALLARADAAMYQAKNGGRNQVVGKKS